MKRLYTTLLLATCFAAQAQIRSSGIFKPDTTVLFSIKETKLNLGIPGLNQIWDFSKVTYVDTAFSRMFVPNAATPGFSSFPTANLAKTAVRMFSGGQLEEEDSFEFLYHNSTRADYLGIYYEDGGYKYTATYQPPLKISITPFVYNQEFTYIVNAKTTSNEPLETASYYVHKGSGKWKKDAKGRAIFPNKKIASNASRFKNTEELFDTITYSSTTSKSYIQSTSESYFILDDQTNESVGIAYYKSVVTSSYTPVGGTTSSNTETYYDTIVVYERSTTLKEIKALATGIDEQQEVLNALVAYPIPSNGVISLNSNQIEFVEIMDTKGVLVDRQKYEGSISLPANNGLYFIKAILPDGRYKSLKVIKE